MDPLLITVLVVIVMLFGVAWHNQPANNPENKSLAENPARPEHGRKP